MTMETTDTLYCSLDLELTGFDPSRDTILEVGFVFFRLNDSRDGFEIIEEWSQTFRSTVPVHPKILGLTGLTQAELDESPPFQDFREFIQDKVGDAVLVGHNIIVDITFLEAFGIKLSGRSVDTLDLVQWLLPTHHSYNLENLMHYFQVPHPEAHRALADSIAVIRVLEKLLALFAGLLKELQAQVLDLAGQGNFAWADLFRSASFPSTASPAHIKTPENIAESRTLLAVGNKLQALKLWQEGEARAVFPNTDLFNKAKFRAFLSRPGLLPDEIKFGLKILVWQATNWQTATILDLNLTFFGGQFRTYITPAPFEDSFGNSALATDYSSLPYVTKHLQNHSRELSISSAHEFERDLSTGTERRLSWQKCLYTIRSLEAQAEQNGTGTPAQIFTEAVMATDLFFGLVNLTVQRHFAKYAYVSLQDLEQQEIADRHVRQAAEHYVGRLAKLFANNPPEEISRLTANLQNFFANNPDYIKWIETSATNCIFFNQPLHVLEDSKQIIESFSVVTASEDFGEPVLSYLSARLGLESGEVNQQEMLSGTKKINLQIIDGDVFNLLQPEHLPAAAIMGSLQDIKDFYNANYDQLKQYASLYAQGYSGGSNKIIRNFGIKPESILLATSQLLLQQDSRRITPKTLVITGFPHENPHHPYTKALCSYWRERFPDIEAILDTYLLLRLLKTCLHDGLETIYVLAPTTDRDRYIYQTLQELPFLNSNPQT